TSNSCHFLQILLENVHRQGKCRPYHLPWQLMLMSYPAVQERGECLRSRDCAAGLCCVLYQRSRRCQRIPQEDQFCLLPGRNKARRELGLCDCRPGLHCRPQNTFLEKNHLSVQVEYSIA
uniref:Dickkopf N-terminal cysteine-rich domain-containing protein n=1 Tax=Electrophorus electricus TaxID=8005 RepID=A0A4W4FKC4_ELEEL